MSYYLNDLEINVTMVSGDISPKAGEVDIVDVGNYYTSEYVEGALQEVGFETRGIYDDLPPSPIISARTGATPPDLTTFVGNTKQYTFNSSTHEVYGSTEITHRYKEGTDIMPHIHWATNGLEAVNKYVKWELEYCVSSNHVFGPAVVVSTEVLVPANTANRSHFISGFDPDIVGTNLKIGDYIVWRLRRIPSVGSAVANNPFAIAVGFHIEQDGLGSSQLYIK